MSQNEKPGSAGGLLSLSEIREAAARIRDDVVRTPSLRLELRADTVLWLKAESLQPTGSFKQRGAFNALRQLSPGTPGVVAHSSGNHAQAVARAARELGLRAALVMPNDAPAVKRRRVEADAAEVVEVGPDSAERAERARELSAQRGWPLIVPFDNRDVMVGQGTAALELLEDSGPLDRFYAPVSGGGLMAGCGSVVRSLCPAAEIVAVEPERKDALRRSLASGSREQVDPPDTIADGLRVRRVGELTWPVLRRCVDRVALVSDAELIQAMGLAQNELRLVLEPSGAAALAVALREAKGSCGVILSGGNADPALVASAARYFQRPA